MRTLRPVPLAGMPSQMTVYEVGLRYGLHNEAAIVPASVKISFIVRVATADLQVTEATASFVRKGCRNSSTPKRSSPRWTWTAACATPLLVPSLRVLGQCPGPRRPRDPIFGRAAAA